MIESISPVRPSLRRGMSPDFVSGFTSTADFIPRRVTFGEAPTPTVATPTSL